MSDDDTVQGRAMNGQRAVVFGASSGVGLATAKALAGLGAEVFITSRSEGRVKEALSEIGASASGRAVDGADVAAVEAFFAEVGEIDHLIVPAGATNRGADFTEMTPEALRAAFEGKFWVQMNAAQSGARRIRRGGSLTLVSGGAAHRAIRGMVHVAAVNGAIEAVVPTLALELAPTRVNAISPGTLDTSYWEGVPDEQRRQIFARTAELLPAGRVGTTSDIVNAVLFLTSTSFVTGTVLQVDGGIAHSRV